MGSISCIDIFALSTPTSSRNLLTSFQIVRWLCPIKCANLLFQILQILFVWCLECNVASCTFRMFQVDTNVQWLIPSKFWNHDLSVCSSNICRIKIVNYICNYIGCTNWFQLLSTLCLQSLFFTGKKAKPWFIYYTIMAKDVIMIISIE